jgi:hypothetical protein
MLSSKFITHIHSFICKINLHKIYSKIDTHTIQPLKLSSISQKNAHLLNY